MAPTAKRKRHKTTATGDIAIIGVALRLPSATSLDDLWEQLCNKACFIGDFPASRLQSPDEMQALHAKYQLKNNPAGSFLPDIDTFDAPFFSITRREAELMDPHQRMALELSWQALEDAGYKPSSLAEKNVGVYMGICNADYLSLIAANQSDCDPYIPTGTAYSIVANRISYWFNFRGPSVVSDAACASSLVCLHQAVSALRHERLPLALAGAVNLCSDTKRFVEFSQSGMLSKTGRCKAFDAEADGYVRGEGGVVLVLKTLEQALADNDLIHGLIKGTAMNHGGKTGSLTITNPDAQSDVIAAALNDAKIAANSVTYIEAHGPGTPLGDPIEINGIENAYFKNLKPRTSANWRCGIGSVKTNFGHLEAAAGVLGIAKVLAAMRHGTLPASANFTQLNPIIEIEHTPLFVVTDNQPWDAATMSGIDGCPRRAGVSSFGMGGVNTHVILEEYPNNRNNPSTEQYLPCLILLSAKTGEQLAEQAKNLLRYVKRHPLNAAELVNLAYTLQVGREEFEQRLALVANNVDSLLQQLEVFIANTATDDINTIFRGTAPADAVPASADQKQSLFDQWFATRDPTPLLKHWIAGGSINWQALYRGDDQPRRMSLPVYPFAKHRYWIEIPARQKTATPAGDTLHPLLHRNTSTLSRQHYTSVFTGEEFFLADHQVQGQKVLPGVAYLEVVRAAVMNATSTPASVPMELRNVVWMRPFIVTQSRQLSVALYPQNEGRIDFEIYSEEKSEEVTHCQGEVLFDTASRPTKLNLHDLERAMDAGELDITDFYARFTNAGIVYGPAHRAVSGVLCGRNEVLAHLTLPETLRGAQSEYFLHPSLLDCALQASTGLRAGTGGRASDAGHRPALPFALESLQLFSPCTEQMLAWVRYSPAIDSGNNSEGGRTLKFDIDLCNQSGEVCAKIRGYSTRTLKTAKSSAVHAAPPGDDQAVEAFNEAFYRQVIDRIVEREITAEEAVELG